MSATLRSLSQLQPTAIDKSVMHGQSRDRTKQQWHYRSRRRRGRSPLDWLVIMVFGGALLWQLLPNVKSAATVVANNPQQLAAIQLSAYYANCDAARAAGVAPLRVSDPGYRDKLDGDGDGIACEPYYGQ